MKSIIFSIGLVGLISFGCEVEQGPEGPEGPEGNANVISYQFDVSPTDWVEQGTVGTANHSYTYLVDDFVELTQSITDEGLIMAYLIRADLFNTTYQALPLQEPEQSFNRRWEYLFAPGSIGFVVRHSDFNTLRPSNTVRFKVVLANGITGKHRKELEEMEWEEKLDFLMDLESK
jgi:hypothetical protein